MGDVEDAPQKRETKIVKKEKLMAEDKRINEREKEEMKR